LDLYEGDYRLDERHGQGRFTSKDGALTLTLTLTLIGGLPLKTVRSIMVVGMTI